MLTLIDENVIINCVSDVIQISSGHMTRVCTHKVNDTLNQMVTTIKKIRQKLKDFKSKMVNCISSHKEEWGA